MIDEYDTLSVDQCEELIAYVKNRLIDEFDSDYLCYIINQMQSKK